MVEYLDGELVWYGHLLDSLLDFISSKILLFFLIDCENERFFYENVCCYLGFFYLGAGDLMFFPLYVSDTAISEKLIVLPFLFFYCLSFIRIPFYSE